MNKKSSYEGRQETIRNWKTPKIEVFKNIYSDREYQITMSVNEFSCICPKTGLPDFAVLKLSYIPNKTCIELKSFKEYLLAFRDRGIFHENVVNKVLDDVVNAIQPISAKLVGVFNSRGGIQTDVERSYASRP